MSIKIERDGTTATISPPGETGEDRFRFEVSRGSGLVDLAEGTASISITADLLLWLRDHGIDAALREMGHVEALADGEISQKHAREMYQLLNQLSLLGSEAIKAHSIISAIESSWLKPWLDKNGDEAKAGMAFERELDGIIFRVAAFEGDNLVTGDGGYLSREWFRRNATLFHLVQVRKEAPNA